MEFIRYYVNSPKYCNLYDSSHNQSFPKLSLYIHSLARKAENQTNLTKWSQFNQAKQIFY